MKMNFRTLLATLALALAACGTPPADEVGSAGATGWVFKDQVKILAFDDPTITGVTCYTTYYDRSMSWDNSSSASIACRKTGEIKGELTDKPNVFASTKGWFKTTRVDRFYDAKRGVLNYLSYTAKGGGGNTNHSISVVVVR